jgi:hypothetical protein
VETNACGVARVVGAGAAVVVVVDGASADGGAITFSVFSLSSFLFC